MLDDLLEGESEDGGDPVPELVLGVLDDVLEGEAEDGGVLNLLEVEQEGNLPLQGFP